MNNYKFIPNDEYFQKIRFKTIGASDLPIICGLSKYKTPYLLWCEKTGREKSFEGNEATKWGHKHEVNILSSYIEQNRDEQTAYEFEVDYITHRKERSNRYIPPTNYFPYTEFFHPYLKFAIAHPDMIDMENKLNIEAKSGKHYANIKREGIDGFDSDDPKGYPLKYYIQVQWQLLCTGLKETILRALIDTNIELSYTIKENKIIQEKLIEVASKFYWHMKKNKEPKPLSKKDIEKKFPFIKNESYYLVGTQSELATKMKNRKDFLKEKIKKYEDEVNDINDALGLLIKDNKYLYNENNEKICSQVNFTTERLKGLSDIKKTDYDLYLSLKDKNLIIDSEVRYVR